MNIKIFYFKENLILKFFYIIYLIFNNLFIVILFFIYNILNKIYKTKFNLILKKIKK